MPTVNRELLRLAVPNILANVSVPLLSSVDTALMGGLSAAHLGAVGIGGMVFNFVYWNFGFLRMGTTGLTAQAFGAGDAGEVAATLTRASLLALGLAAVLWAGQVPLYELAAWSLNVPAASGTLVAEYFYVRIWAAPASLLLYVATGWLFGMQNARLPLLIALSVNGVNIALSYYLVVGRGLGTAGVAWGTVGAQYAGLALAAAVLWWRFPQNMRVVGLGRLRDYRRLLRVNGDIFLRTLCLTFAFGFLYSRAAADSAMSLAVVTVLLQFLNWMSYGVDGFAYACESLVGKYAGARDGVRLRKTVRLGFAWGGALAVGFAVLYWGVGERLIGVFTDSAAVRVRAGELLPFLVALPLVGTACYILDGVAVGLTATRVMRDTMAAALLVFLASYWGLRGWAGELEGLWGGLLLFLGARGVLLGGWWRSRDIVKQIV